MHQHGRGGRTILCTARLATGQHWDNVKASFIQTISHLSEAVKPLLDFTNYRLLGEVWGPKEEVGKVEWRQSRDTLGHHQSTLLTSRSSLRALPWEKCCSKRRGGSGILSPALPLRDEAMGSLG